MLLKLFTFAVGIAVSLSANAEETKKYLPWKDDAAFKAELKDWTKANRKVAGTVFTETQLMKDAPDFPEFRTKVLEAKSGDALEELLLTSNEKYDGYSESLKFFLAQLHVAIPLRGIVWRLRPLFEEGQGFFGTRGSHVAAVQFVRTVATGLSMYLPTEQSTAFIEYFTQPSKKMATADQFRSMEQFQEFLETKFAKALLVACDRIAASNARNTGKVFIWDNKTFYGKGKFQDGINRFIGMGPAERNAALSYLWRARHDALVFSAYNQNELIKVAGKLGSHMGIDAAFAKKTEDFGLTDFERHEVIEDAVKGKDFLKIRSTKERPRLGKELMNEAYTSLFNSVMAFQRAYKFLSTQKTTEPAMVLNPVLFQPGIVPQLNVGVENMVNVVSKKTPVLDKVSGDPIEIDLPNYYSNPPESLYSLSAIDWERNTPMEKEIRGRDGKPMKFRIYTHGRAIAWNNTEWAKYVPSAKGKPPGYMAEARRIAHFSLGTSAVFNLPDIFVH